MKRHHKFFCLITTLIIISMACNISGPAPEDDQAAFSTAVAQTAQAQFIQLTMQAQSSQVASTAAQPTDPLPTVIVPTEVQPTSPPPTAVPPTAVPPTAVPPTAPPPDVFAPNPLGPAWSSMAFNSGTCYDLDVLFTAADATADVCLDANVILSPQNGGTFSGNAFMTAPSKNQCRAAALNANPLAPLTDAYLCFQTNTGSYGFFVMRDDQMLSSGYIVFDAYIFP